MDRIEHSNLFHACGTGEPKDKIKQCSGILLTDIIEEAKVIIQDHNDTKKMYIIARSNDGYATLFSWQELFNTSVGQGVVLLLERDGRKLYREQEHLDIISTNDFLSGPRYVKQLSVLEIKSIS